MGWASPMVVLTGGLSVHPELRSTSRPFPAWPQPESSCLQGPLWGCAGPRGPLAWARLELACGPPSTAVNGPVPAEARPQEVKPTREITSQCSVGAPSFPLTPTGERSTAWSSVCVLPVLGPCSRTSAGKHHAHCPRGPGWPGLRAPCGRWERTAHHWLLFSPLAGPSPSCLIRV